ncbi:MAG TPA: hypothetical protein VHB18_17395 [Mycobacteriales bacterium]|jgi:hypothetical protein|nr:hypothetical protein [Mycobacteriales bacterium]
MHKISNKKKAAAVLGAGAMAVAGSGVAFAYWTQGGSGTGAAVTGSTSNVTVVSTTPTSSLYPGGSVALSGKFDNPNPGSVRIGTVTATVGTLPEGCVSGDFSISGTAAVNAEIPTGSNVGSWSGITLSMNDTGVSQDACKTATIPVTFSVN